MISNTITPSTGFLYNQERLDAIRAREVLHELSFAVQLHPDRVLPISQQRHYVVHINLHTISFT